MLTLYSRVLLELSAMLTRLQSWLPKAIDLPIIRFDDALGNTLALPYQMCEEWRVRTDLQDFFILANIC
jgi:hypothetical protein